MATSILIWIHSSPFNSSAAREALDYAFAMAAVDHQVHVLLSGPAVLVLLPHQQLATNLHLKDFTKAMGLFALYDMPAPLVSAECRQQYQLDNSQLTSVAKVISTAQLTLLLSDYQHVVSF